MSHIVHNGTAAIKLVLSFTTAGGAGLDNKRLLWHPCAGPAGNQPKLLAAGAHTATAWWRSYLAPVGC